MTLPLFPTRTPDVAHRCHARDCHTAVQPELLMCLMHWTMVPRTIKRAVWAHYRPGQCDDKDVSREWLQAADAAIGSVARIEGKVVRQIELDALASFGLAGSP